MKPLLLLYLFAMQSLSTSSPFEALRAYNGTWAVTIGSAKPDVLLNQCNETAAFYNCAQVLNGKPIALVVFTTTEESHKFHSQVVLPNGNAVGRSDLTVDGQNWTYHSSGTGEGGKPVFYRTENTFSGRDKIHFEQFESADDKTWVKKGQGDEVRTGG